MTRLNILISGGGIAGNALAFWMSKLGHNVTVVERFPSLRATGLQLDLRGYGIQVLKLMGLEQAFRAKSAPEQGLQIVGKSGKRWAYFPSNTTGEGLQDFTTDYEIMRGDLCRLFYDATQNRARYIFGTSIEALTEKDDDVEVRFANGQTERYDLVVGADGQGSRTRKLMMAGSGSDNNGFTSIGNRYTGYFTMNKPMDDGEEYVATSYTAPGKRFIMTRRHNPDQVQVYFICHSDTPRLRAARPGDVAEEKAAMAEIFKDAGWRTEELLEAMKRDNDFYCERIGVVKLDSWSRGRVVLVGDAGYCPSSFTGMGTTSAVVGAYILAGEIGRHCGSGDGEKKKASSYAEIQKALKAYEDKFRPFMTQVQRGISEDTWNWFPSGSIGVTLTNCFMGIASFFRVNILGKFLLREDVKDWDLPEYKEMLD